jgi:hypothetical protein
MRWLEVATEKNAIARLLDRKLSAGGEAAFAAAERCPSAH